VNHEAHEGHEESFKDAEAWFSLEWWFTSDA
jgi:hypothetical protein